MIKSFDLIIAPHHTTTRDLTYGVKGGLLVKTEALRTTCYQYR